MGIFDIALTASAVVGIALLAFFLFRKTTFTTITVRITNPNPLYSGANPPTWYASAFHKGDKELDTVGTTQAEILEVHAYSLDETRQIVFLKLRVRAVYSRSKNQYTYKGNPLIIGSSIHLEFTNNLVDGIVTEIANAPTPYKEKMITVQATMLEYNPIYPETDGVDDFKANAIQVGDTMKDNNGKVIATIVNKSVAPADRYVTNQGTVSVVPDPLKKHVSLTILVRTYELNGVALFLYSFPVQVGGTLPLDLPNITIGPTITDIVSVQ